MKSRLRLKVCETRQRGIEFRDEVYYYYHYYYCYYYHDCYCYCYYYCYYCYYYYCYYYYYHYYPLPLAPFKPPSSPLQAPFSASPSPPQAPFVTWLRGRVLLRTTSWTLTQVDLEVFEGCYLSGAACLLLVEV